MDPNTNVLLADGTTKKAADLKHGDTLFPFHDVSYVKKSIGYMYKLTLSDDTELTLDSYAKVLAYIPRNPVVEFDDVTDTYSIEFIDHSQRIRKCSLPISKMTKINTIKEKAEKETMIQITSIERMLKTTGIGNGGVYLISKLYDDLQGGEDIEMVTNIEEIGKGDYIKVYCSSFHPLPVTLTQGYTVM